LVKVPLPLVVHDMVPLVAVYPAGIVYERALAHAVSLCLLPAVAIGAGSIVSANEAVAGGHTPPSATVIVSVMTPPVAESLGPNV
jgi:hypothetical protein